LNHRLNSSEGKVEAVQKEIGNQLSGKTETSLELTAFVGQGRRTKKAE